MLRGSFSAGCFLGVPPSFFQLPLGRGPRAGAFLILFALSFLPSSITADQFSTKSVLILYKEQLELPGKTRGLYQDLVPDSATILLGERSLWEEHGDS